MFIPTVLELGEHSHEPLSNPVLIRFGSARVLEIRLPLNRQTKLVA